MHKRFGDTTDRKSVVALPEGALAPALFYRSSGVPQQGDGAPDNVVGVSPTRQAVVRLMGAVPVEQQDEWESGRCYFSMDSMRKALEEPREQLPVVNSRQ